MYNLEDNFTTRTAITPFIPSSKFNLKDEQIYVASKSLYDAMNRSNDITEQVKISLKKYNIRSYSRTTPFGLFTSMNYHNFKNLSNNKPYKVQIDLESEWLYKVIDLFETKNLYNVSVIWNDSSLRVLDNKIENMWNSNNSMNFNGQSILINYTRAVQKIKKYTVKEIKIKELINILKRDYPEIEETFLSQFLKELINKEFLYTNYRSYIYANDKTDSLKQFIKDQKIDDYLLCDIVNSIINIRKEKSISVDQIKELEKKQAQIVQTDKYLKIEMAGGNYNFNVNQDKISEDISKSIDYLSNISQYMNDSELASLNNYFIEKYGYEKIRFTDFFTQFTIDKRSVIKNTLLNQSGEEFNSFYKGQLENKALSAFENGKEEIDLLEINDFSKFDKLFNKPPLFTMGMYISTKDNKNTYVVSPVVGADSLCRLQGRFSSFDTNEYSYLKQTENNIYSKCNIKVIDVHYTPSNKHLANIMDYSYEEDDIIFNFGYYFNGINERININDIYITTDGKQLVFITKIHGKEEIVLFRAKNMSNTSILAPEMIDFLIKNSNKYFNSIFVTFEICSMVFKMSTHSPRIKIGNLTIQPRRWYLDNILNEDTKSNKTQFIKEFKAILREYKIPDNVYLASQDLRLFVNTDTDIDVIWDTFKKHDKKISYIFLEEVAFDYSHLVTTSNNKDPYISEFLFNFINTSNIDTTNLTNCLKNKFGLEKREIIKNINSNWIYAKVYCEPAIQNVVLKRIAPLCKNKLFYIKYVDNEKNSLRIRVLPNDYYDAYSNIVSILYDAYIDNLIQEFEFCTYHPEIQRYGGENIYHYVENYFCSESMAFILCLDDDKFYIRKERYYLSIFLVLNLVLNYFGNIESALKFLNKQYDSNMYRKEYREDKNVYLSLLTSPPIPLEKLKQLNSDIAKMKDRILDEKIDDEYLSHILFSIIHMTCNRIIDVSPIEEEQVSFIARHILNDMYNRAKFCKN